jgi:hypothetical protein
MKNLLSFIKQNAGILSAGIFFETIFLLFFLIEPLRRYLGDTGATLHNNSIFIILVLALIFQSIAYIGIRQKINKYNFKIIFIFFLLFNLTLLFVWPIASNDLFVYISQGRLISLGHLNPYVNSYSSLMADPLFSQINTPWTNYHTSLYGPFFLTISAFLTLLGGNSLILSILLFKVFFVFLNIVCGYLVYKLSQSTEIFFLYAWNPLILFELAANGHNDVMTIFLLLLSLFFFLKVKEQTKKNYWLYLSYAFLLASVLIKYFTAILLPIFFIYTILLFKDKKEKFFYFTRLLVITIIILSTSYYFFWNGSKTLLELNSFIAGGVAGIFFSPFIITALIFSIVIFAGSEKFLLHYHDYVSAICLISKFLFLFFYISLLYNILKKHSKKLEINSLNKYYALAFCFFIIFSLTWLMPWYFTMLITLLILYYGFSGSKLPLIASNFFLFYGILYYLILR